MIPNALHFNHNTNTNKRLKEQDILIEENTAINSPQPISTPQLSSTNQYPYGVAYNSSLKFTKYYRSFHIKSPIKTQLLKRTLRRIKWSDTVTINLENTAKPLLSILSTLKFIHKSQLILKIALADYFTIHIFQQLMRFVAIEKRLSKVGLQTENSLSLINQLIAIQQQNIFSNQTTTFSLEMMTIYCKSIQKLKKLQSLSLNMGFHSSLFAEQVQMLASQLVAFQYLKQLQINFCLRQLSQRDFDNFSSKLAQMLSLEDLSLVLNGVSELTQGTLFDSFAQMKQLKQFRFKTSKPLDADGLKLFSQKISQLQRLERLEFGYQSTQSMLAYNSLVNDGLRQLRTLKNLKLEIPQLQSDQMVALLESTRRINNLQDLSLILYEANFTSGILNQIGKNFSKFTSLKTLNFSLTEIQQHNPQIFALPLAQCPCLLNYSLNIYHLGKGIEDQDFNTLLTHVYETTHLTKLQLGFKGNILFTLPESLDQLRILLEKGQQNSSVGIKYFELNVPKYLIQALNDNTIMRLKRLGQFLQEYKIQSSALVWMRSVNYQLGILCQEMLLPSSASSNFIKSQQTNN